MTRLGDRWVLWGIIAGLLAGGAVGAAYPETGVELAFLGDLFLNALKLMIVPLIVCSMIAGIASLGDVRRLGRVGARTLLYYFCTTGIAVIIGLAAVNLVRPGEPALRRLSAAEFEEAITRRLDRAEAERARLAARGQSDAAPAARAEEARRLLDGIDPVPARFAGEEDAWRFMLSRARDRAHAEALAAQPVAPEFLPDHPRRAPLASQLALLGQEEAVQGDFEKVGKAKGHGAFATFKEVLLGMVPPNIVAAALELKVLTLILVSLLFGGILTTLGAPGRRALDFFGTCNEAVLRLVGLLMWYSPVGIFGLVAGRLGQVGGGAALLTELAQIGAYAATVIGGLVIHAVVVLPLILRLFGRRGPWGYLRGVSKALLTAFSTASSSATLPTTLRCVEKEAGVSGRAASFVLPLGATINMDGTALYEAVAVLFIAQTLGLELGFGAMIVIFLTATLASIGAAGIPSAGLVTMVMVLEAVHIPADGIALILMIDWFLDRCRTTVNVWGDAVGAAVIDAGLDPASPGAAASTTS